MVQVINGLGISQILVINRVRVLESGPHYPIHLFWEYSPRGIYCIFPIFFSSVYSGAPAARRAAKRSPIIIEKGTTRMHRNGNPCNSFLMVKMASGMDHGRVRPTTTTTTTNDVAQHGGHPANTKLCSLGLQHISLILIMHIMCN